VKILHAPVPSPLWTLINHITIKIYFRKKNAIFFGCASLIISLLERIRRSVQSERSVKPIIAWKINFTVKRNNNKNTSVNTSLPNNDGFLQHEYS
jgi:hypothetical protein